jgi:hypothetical protein
MIVEALHNDRVREAQKSARVRVISDVSEAQPNVVEGGWLVQIRQWMQSRQFRSGNVRRAHAH